MFKLFKLFAKTTTTDRPTVANVTESTIKPVNEPTLKEAANGVDKERRLTPRPFAQPEVIEGDGGNTDWGLWEDLAKKKD